MNCGGFEPIRNGRNELIGWTRKDPRSGVIHIYNKESKTIGWAKQSDNSGPGYTVMSQGNERVTQGCNPEYLLGVYYERNRSTNSMNYEPKPTNWLFKGQGQDGSDPRY